MSFNAESAMRVNPPAPAQSWKGFPKYNFVGGHNDSASIPAKELAVSVTSILNREGSDLATYGLQSGPQGYTPFREAIASMLNRRAGMREDANSILVTSGSLQALSLIFDLFLDPGDVVLLEKACYGGTLSRLRTRSVEYVGVELDQEGMRADSLDQAIRQVKAKGKRPKMIYTIPTVQNPTGRVMSEERRHQIIAVAKEHDLPIFEDDCYADLIFAGGRPPAIRALDDDGRVVYCGSFSKSIGPAIRVGFIAADWPILSRLLALKTDGGTGAIEQMALSEYLGEKFDAHVDSLNKTLKTKAEAMADAIDEHFGASAEFERPKSGIFLWLKLPDAVDTSRLYQVASSEGVAINPGADWSTEETYGKKRLRLCFANPSVENIRQGISKLADICHREFGIPHHSSNTQRQ
jgi:2-aminoadipate transaminase